MNISTPTLSEIQSVSFSFYSSQELYKLSVLSVNNPILLDGLGHPNPNGLYDLALGPVDRNSSCKTCGLDEKGCPGHFGHIDLLMPVYNPITFKLMYKLLQSTCLYCHSLKTSKSLLKFYILKLKLIHAGFITEAYELDDYLSVIKTSSKTQDSDDDEEGPSVEKFEKKIEKRVSEILNSKVWNSQKSILKTEAQRKMERQVLSSIPSLACANCGGQSAKFRQDSGSKIFQKPLSLKQKSLMTARGKYFQPLKYPNLKKSQDFTEKIENMDFNDTDLLLLPIQVAAHLYMMWEQNSELFDLLYGSYDPIQKKRVSSPDVFFIEVVPVPPNRFRPMSKMGDMTYEHPQNTHLTQIIKDKIRIADLLEQEKKALEVLDSVENPKAYDNTKSDYAIKTIEALVALQNSVNSLIDNSKAGSVGGTPPPPGIRQILEKKEGLFRKHMMGKRVNYAARSVISPDPYIETSEIGIPPVFAKKLTYPEPVTHHNIETLRQYVINGPNQWPGASFIQNEDGELTNLAHLDESGRTALANQLLVPSSNSAEYINKKVFRHLRNGDFLLLNRQPTLHKPSIMAHTARILPGEKTIRMHYANCNTYNADFDGDEMNIHFPQNEIARSEAMLIARTDLQYLVPTDGGVLRGLIQDHVDAGVDMSSRDTFLNRETYMQIVFQALQPDGAIGSGIGNGNIEREVILGRDGRIVTIQPAILKPKPRWTGKQVITTILLNLLPENRSSLNLISKSKIPAKAWGGSAPEEQTVIFMDGCFLTGILDKSQFGASAHGLVHSVYEVYGPQYAGKLLSILGRLFTSYLQVVGFSCRMDDLMLTPKGDQLRKELINKSRMLGHQVAAEVSELRGDTDILSDESKTKIRAKLEECLRNDEQMAYLDSCMKSKTNRITSEIIAECIPGNLLKPFPQNNMQMMTVSGAKGSNVNVSQISCLLGQQELEGRRVPTMVSGKTLPSFTPFDTSARAGGFISGRFLTGIKPQEYFYHCMAGREGLIDTAVKTSRSGYLQRCLIKHLEGLRVHYDQTVRDLDGSVLQFQYGEDSLDVLKQKTLDKLDFCAMNYQALLQRYDTTKLAGKIDEEAAYEYLESHKDSKTADPVLSHFNPARYIGSVSNKFSESIDEYIDKNPGNFLLKKTEKSKSGWSNKKIKPRRFRTLMDVKYMHSLVEPGESVGLLAAQSIGEPSTQMTLNTFHFAGFGAKNVTLGIPRLREIIMTASANIKTPMMKLPLLPKVSEQKADDLAKKISKLVLSQIIDKVVVIEKIGAKASTRMKHVTINVHFWEKELYLSEYGLHPFEIKRVIEKKFIPALERAITRELKQRSKKSAEVVDDDIGIGFAVKGPETRAEKKVDEADSDDDAPSSEIGGDDDATAAKSSRNRIQHASYDAPDEDDQDIISKIKTENYELDEENNAELEQSTPLDSPKTTGTTTVTDSCDYISSFDFDVSEGCLCRFDLKFPINFKKLLFVAMIENLAKQVTIRELKGVSRAYIMPNESENDTTINIGTDGVNFQGIWLLPDEIDLTKIYTNDVAAVLVNYGVEAARAAIMQEIAGVFGVYGINVDPRHLSLIADYMTFEGGYKPFNRMGMNSNPSPFSQMSFETTTSFLTTATLSGDFDPLESPSSCLVMGKVVKSGTGSFEIRNSIRN